MAERKQKITAVPMAGGGTSDEPMFNCYCLLLKRRNDGRDSPQPLEVCMTGTPQEVAKAIAWWEMRKGGPCDQCHGRFGDGPCRQEHITAMVVDAKAMLGFRRVMVAHDA